MTARTELFYERFSLLPPIIPIKHPPTGRHISLISKSCALLSSFTTCPPTQIANFPTIILRKLWKCPIWVVAHICLLFYHYTILYHQVNKKKPARYLRSISITHPHCYCLGFGTAYAPFVASLVRTQGGVTVTGCILDRPGHLYLEAPQLLRLSAV